MKGKNNQHKQSGRMPQLSPLMVEDKATEKLKKRLQDWGLIVNAGADKAANPPGKKKGDRK